MKINNIDQLQEEFIWKDTLGLITRSLGASAGSQKIYINFDTVPPGAYSTKYHSHSQQEEFFLVLSGKKEDTCYYPDEDVYMHKSNGQIRIIKGSDLDTSWTSEPNDKK